MIKSSLPKKHFYLKEYLQSFHRDHPDPDKNIFLIMRFRDDHPFPIILKVIEKSCKAHGLNPVRADQKTYCEDLWNNVLTYIYGCNYGIAVFDQINYREFNPNIAIEVGFMMAQTKNLLLLKDQAIPALPSDIVGKIYHPFDTHSPDKTIPPQMKKWFESFLS